MYLIHAARMNPNDHATSNDDLIEQMVVSEDVTIHDTQTLSPTENVVTRWWLIGYAPDGFVQTQQEVDETTAQDAIGSEGMDAYDSALEIDHVMDGNHTIRVIMRALGTPIIPPIMTVD